MPSSISLRPLLRGITFQTDGSVIKNSDLSVILETPWSISLSLVKPKHGELFVQALCKEMDIRKE